MGSKDKRFKDKFIRTPSPGRYEVGLKKDVEPAAAPFGIKEIYKRPENNNPG